MPLTPEEQEARLRELATDDVVLVRQALRDAFWRWVCWPFSRRRVDAFFDAFERVQDLNANRAMGNVESFARLFATRLTDLEQRVAALERSVGLR